MQSAHDGEIGQHAEQNIRHGRANGGDENAFFAADLVHQRAVDQKGKAINHRADGENGAELLFGHQRAERVLGDVQIVAAHVEERVGHAQRKPVDEAAEHEPPAVLQRVVAKVEQDDHGQAKPDQRIGMVQNRREQIHRLRGRKTDRYRRVKGLFAKNY